MMRVEEHAVAATGNDAPPAVAAHDLSPNARRDRLAGATARFAHVGGHVTQVLRIASRHFDDLRADFDLLAAPLLPTPAARFAHRERNLVVGAALVRRTAVRQRFRADLEPKHVPLEVRITRILRKVPDTVSGHQLFDPTSGPSPRRLEPRVLVFSRCHPGELANRGPTRKAVTERLPELG